MFQLPALIRCLVLTAGINKIVAFWDVKQGHKVDGYQSFEEHFPSKRRHIIQ